METTIYHNPRCSKSRQALAILHEAGVEPKIIEYLKTPPSEAEIEHLLALLDLEPRDLMRHNEKEYAELGLDDASLDRARLVRAIHEYPRLLQRPVVIRGDQAVVGRPPERVRELLANA